MPMKDSKLDDAWLARAIAANPMRKLPNGNILSGPVRLSFVYVDEPRPKQANADGTPNDGKPAYETAILFPHGAEAGIAQVLWPELYAAIRQFFPGNIGSDGQPFGLHSAFRDQREKQKYQGYTPGLTFISASSQFKPPVVDTSMNPIVNVKDRCYAGVWAIVAMNVYDYGRNPPRPKKGVKFGLQSLMIIADDTRIDGGGGSDPTKDFGTVNIDANYDPTKQFGMTTPQGHAAPPPAAFMPPAAPVFTSAPPPGYAPAGYQPPPPPALPAPTFEDLI